MDTVTVTGYTDINYEDKIILSISCVVGNYFAKTEFIVHVRSYFTVIYVIMMSEKIDFVLTRDRSACMHLCPCKIELGVIPVNYYLRVNIPEMFEAITMTGIPLIFPR